MESEAISVMMLQSCGRCVKEANARQDFISPSGIGQEQWRGYQLLISCSPQEDLSSTNLASLFFQRSPIRTHTSLYSKLRVRIPEGNNFLRYLSNAEHARRAFPACLCCFVAVFCIRNMSHSTFGVSQIAKTSILYNSHFCAMGCTLEKTSVLHASRHEELSVFL